MKINHKSSVLKMQLFRSRISWKHFISCKIYRCMYIGNQIVHIKINNNQNNQNTTHHLLIKV